MNQHRAEKIDDILEKPVGSWTGEDVDYLIPEVLPGGTGQALWLNDADVAGRILRELAEYLI